MTRFWFATPKLYLPLGQVITLVRIQMIYHIFLEVWGCTTKLSKDKKITCLGYKSGKAINHPFQVLVLFNGSRLIELRRFLIEWQKWRRLLSSKTRAIFFGYQRANPKPIVACRRKSLTKLIHVVAFHRVVCPFCSWFKRIRRIWIQDIIGKAPMDNNFITVICSYVIALQFTTDKWQFFLESMSHSCDVRHRKPLVEDHFMPIGLETTGPRA